MSDNTDLIERVKAATGADEYLDARIHVEVFGGMAAKDGDTSWMRSYGHKAVFTADPKLATGWRHTANAPAYTASIDAIVALIEAKLPGCFYSSGRPVGGGKRKRKPDNVRVPYDAFIATSDNIGEPGYRSALTEGFTQAVALCLAFLQSIQPTKEG